MCGFSRNGNLDRSVPVMVLSGLSDVARPESKVLTFCLNKLSRHRDHPSNFGNLKVLRGGVRSGFRPQHLCDVATQPKYSSLYLAKMGFRRLKRSLFVGTHASRGNSITTKRQFQLSCYTLAVSRSGKHPRSTSDQNDKKKIVLIYNSFTQGESDG